MCLHVRAFAAKMRQTIRTIMFELRGVTPNLSSPRVTREQEIEALQALDRVMASPALGAGQRLPAILRYVVTEELAGRGDRIKSFSIATEVLGRKDFDPQSDGIARAEMTRLRKALDHHYASVGRGDPVRIDIPKGSYRPSIRFAPTIAAELDAPALPAPDRRPAPWPRISILAVPLALLLASALALATLFGGLGRAPPPVQPVDMPWGGAGQAAPLALVIVPPATEASIAADEAAFAQGLQAEIVANLTETGWLTLILPHAEADIEPALAARGSEDRTYLLDLRMAPVDGRHRIWAVVTRMPERAVIWSSSFPEGSLRQQSAQLVREVTTAIGADLRRAGSSMSEMIRRIDPEDRTESQFMCLVAVRQYWHSYAADARGRALACLSDEIAVNGAFLEGRAAMALLKVDEARRAPPRERAALLDAARALTALSDRPGKLALQARMAVAACMNDSAALTLTASALIESFGNDPDVKADVASKLALVAGDWPRALALDGQARAQNPFPKPWYALTGVTRALLDGASAHALGVSAVVPQRGFAIGHAMLLAVAGATKDGRISAAARSRLADLGIEGMEQTLAPIDGECWSEPVKQAYRAAILAAP